MLVIEKCGADSEQRQQALGMWVQVEAEETILGADGAEDGRAVHAGKEPGETHHQWRINDAMEDAECQRTVVRRA